MSADRPWLTARRERALLAAAIWRRYVRVRLLLRRAPLPRVVDELSAGSKSMEHSYPPRQLGRIVYRALSIGRLQPRCLTLALIHYSLLRKQDEPAQLVIGLPEASEGVRAHAWVEVGGLDVGPPPGRRGHGELARFG